MAVNLGAQGISIPGLYPGRGKPRKIGQAESFIMSALAPSGAVVFTNPFDTAKVRMQLQGQSQRKYGAQAPILYKNSADAIRKIYVNEGIRGLQKGLTPAILREGSKNFFRIGMYDPIMNMIHDPKDGRAPGWKRVIAGSLSGMMGAVSCNPFELVKTRLQSAAAGKLAVGHQYGYTGVTSALVSIYKQDGLSGLYRGSFLSMGRSFVGSGANLSSFSLMKEYLTTEFHWEDDIWLDMVCGLGSGVVSCIFMNPIDVVRTRYYNQPYVNGKGELYSGALDAITKITTHEGLTAFYKGFWPHFLRIGPHFCLTFVFLGLLRRSTTDAYSYLDKRDSFKAFDMDSDGSLNINEIKNAVQTIFAPVLDKNSDQIPVMVERILAKSKDKDRVSFQEYGMMEQEIKAIYKELQKV